MFIKGGEVEKNFIKGGGGRIKILWRGREVEQNFYKERGRSNKYFYKGKERSNKNLKGSTLMKIDSPTISLT